MPIIIKRTDSPTLTPANDWDKAAGLVIIIVASLLLAQELFFGGLLIALIDYFKNDLNPEQRKEAEVAKNVMALVVIHSGMFGIANILAGWGVYQKAKWGFLLGPIVNGLALAGVLFFLHDWSNEWIFLAVGVTGYCLARIFGALGPKP